MPTSAADLFERYHAVLYGFMRRMTGSTDGAQDLTQDVFLRVLQGLPRYEHQGRDAAWIFQIARNVLSDHAARRERHSAVRLADMDEFSRECRHLAAFGFNEAVALVTEPEREAFLLREQVGLSYEEIAKVCGITEEAVRSRLYRARRQLRQLLSGRLVGDRPEAHRGNL